MKKQIITILGFIFVLSCQTLPRRGYENIKARAFKTHIDSLKIVPESKLELKKFQRLTLGKEDLSLYYFMGSDSNKIESLYETAQIDIPKSGTYLITIESICSPLGFENLIFVPLLQVRDKLNNKKIEITQLSSELLPPSFRSSSLLKKTWIFNAEKKGSYLLLIYSDNTKLNFPLGQQSSMGYYGTLTYTVATFKSNVSGSFRVKVEELE
ncbi:hypothetical protein H7U19_16080 [Hyunsoonleella sp. SJ7]|uniref:Lipoprotein n=1 Tax=Hyunsoonleella aquatilis TaxID=2762758 RepID=A0A923HKE3_9FLAO|nr:hypothetical protein [Hyunsoonleella aquatilis]MBC3759932.1 hypothetical protein [Hyunsoonleella aquatilis]